MTRARYICLEGVEGTGKTTQAMLLCDYLKTQGKSVLLTKEPGTPWLPVTMDLRGLMLDAKNDDVMTPVARELLSQAIRSIHMEKLIKLALTEYDYIVQDRGVLSGLSYGWACGHSLEWLKDLAAAACATRKGAPLYNIYDDVLLFAGNAAAGLKRAQQAKQEFSAGDVIEAKGAGFMENVQCCMSALVPSFPVHTLMIDGKDIETVHSEVLKVLGLK
jgi:dTMP kinase